MQIEKQRKSLKQFLPGWFAFCLLALLPGCQSVIQPHAGPALWQLEHEGKRLWLFGTIHRLPENNITARIARRRSGSRIKGTPSMPWNTIAIRQAMRAADQLYVELLPLSDDDLINTLSQSLATPEEQEPLVSYLNSEQQTSVEFAATQRGIDLELLRKADPLLVFSLFANTKPAHDGPPAYGADFWLMRIALEQRMEVHGLETLHDRIKALKSAIAKLQSTDQTQVFLRYLETELGELSVTDPEYQELIDLWINGDIAVLSERLSIYARHFPNIHEAFIAARNRNWVAKISQSLLTNDEEEFIAVGIGHMVGPGNLVELLMDEGYMVQRIQ